MMNIEVNTTTATLIPPRESLTPGSVNAVQLQFTFSDEWNGLTKTCVFSNEIETIPAEIQNDVTSVPEEILDEVYRWISVGVSGEDAEGTVIIPTIWCRIGQCLPGVSGRFVTIDMLQAYWSKQEIDLHTEGDGSKFLGDDGVYHYVSQGGGDVTHEELDEALALKADKDAFDALSATVDDKADKSEIITVTTGDGTKYLADDGTYKTIQGGGDVTHEELDAAIAPLATKDEVSAAVAPLATKTELDSAVAGLATTTAMNAALALKADKTELASYAKQYDVNQALATKADKTETQTALAQKADKSEIITVTTGTGTLFLADDGTYKPAAGDPPDLSAYLTKTEAGTTYATKTELADKADASALADYETTAHAEATYATKAELPDTSDMLTKTEASATYATQTELSDYAKQSDIITVTDGDGTQFLANDGTYKRVQTDLSSYLTKTEAEQTYATQTEVADKADKSEIITVTTGTGTLFLADDGTYKPAAGDPPDLSAYLTKTEAGTTYETQTHAAETYATKAEIPDVSGFETTEHASATYATKTELTEGLATKADSADIADMLTKTEAGTTYATQTALTEGLAGKVDTVTLADYETTAHAEATYATKAEIPDVSGFETTVHAEATYATKTELADKADASAVDSALALKADKTELTSYETTEHASATYATKTELTEGLAGKVDTADIADMLTKTEADGTYADKASVYTLENTVEAQGTRITNLETNKADKTEIITVTNGTGTLFLADDGTYKPAAGDPPDLSAYLTKTEAGTTYATKTELADKADSATVTALSGVVTGHTAEIAALQTTKADKSEIPDVSGFETTAHAESTYATKAELPDVSDMLTKTEAGTIYATQTALTEGLASKVNTATLADYETTAHASATYATKAELPDVSDMLTKTEAGTTYETQTHAEQTYLKKDDASEIKTIKSAKHTVTVENGVADIGGTTVSRDDSQTSTNSYSVVTVKQNLPATADATGDEGASFIISKSGTLQGQWQSISVDGVRLTLDSDFAPVRAKANVINTSGNGTLFLADDGTYKPAAGDPPDLSAYLTKTEAGTTYETQTHAAETYATKAELPDVSDMLTKTEAASAYQLKTEAATVALTADFNGSTGVENVSAKVSQTDSGGTENYISVAYSCRPNGTTGGVSLMVGDRTNGVILLTAADIANSLSQKADASALADYETTAHASATYATKAEIPDVSGFETTAHAEATYLKIADASPIKSIIDGDIALTPDANGNVTVGRTSVTVATTPTNPPAISCGIKEYAPAGASANSGAMMFISVAETVTGSTDTYKTARVQITDNQNNSSFANLVSQEWVQEYIASLDGTNMQF